MISLLRQTILATCFVMTVFIVVFASPATSLALSGKLVGLQMKGEYAGSEDCSLCHEKITKKFQRSTHSKLSLKDATLSPQKCEICHGPAGQHLEQEGGRGTIINPKRNPETCFKCHLEKKAEFRLPYHHPVLEGKMGCADCHDPHGDDVRPWSATTLAGVNEACVKCHKSHRGPFVWEHEVMREGCATCHKVHGSMHQKLLIARDNTLCLRCHVQRNFPVVGKSNHATRLPQGTCYSAGCHTAVHGSNFDDHLRY